MWLDSAHVSRECGECMPWEGDPKDPTVQGPCPQLLGGFGWGLAGSGGVDTAGSLPRASLKMIRSREGHPANHVVKDTAFHMAVLWAVTITHDRLCLVTDGPCTCDALHTLHTASSVSGAPCATT